MSTQLLLVKLMRKKAFLQRMVGDDQTSLNYNYLTDIFLFSLILINLLIRCVEALLKAFDDEMAISSRTSRAQAILQSN